MYVIRHVSQNVEFMHLYICTYIYISLYLSLSLSFTLGTLSRLYSEKP